MARCRPQDIVDSLGGFRATLQVRPLHSACLIERTRDAALSVVAQHRGSEDGWHRELQAPTPQFEMLSVRLTRFLDKRQR